MRLDRVAEDVFIMISEMYAQVTATVILTNQGAIVIDTLPYPAESQQILSFVEGKLGPDSVPYVINTHCHADHIYGSYIFRGAQVIAHDQCREILLQTGQPLLDRAKRENQNLAAVELRLPDITFTQEMHLNLGLRHLHLIHTPGHTVDSISVFATDDRVVIAGDTMMPIPHIVRGDYANLIASLRLIQDLKPNFIVQGHGDVLLRGEVDEAIESNICYLNTTVDKVRDIIANNEPVQHLREIDIESCGISRIPLDGLVSRIHMNNVLALYKAFSAAQAPN
ncbi:MAG: MBL fold metallo-hydrolase [Anaerolineae bacterium]